MGWFWDFGYLIVAASILIGLCIWFGKKYKNNTMTLWGCMFALIMAVVFGFEGYSYWFTPEHRTISTGFGIFLAAHPIQGFVVLTAWGFFCWALIVHLVTRKQVKDDK